MEVVRSYQCENLLGLVETYTVDCDWKVLLTGRLVLVY